MGMSGLDMRKKLLLVSSLRVNAVADIRTVMATSRRWLKASANLAVRHKGYVGFDHP